MQPKETLPTLALDVEEPEQESTSSEEIQSWPLPGVLSRGGRRRPQLVVEFDMTPTICNPASPSTSPAPAKVLLAPASVDLADVPRKRWRPVSIATPSSCTSTPASAKRPPSFVQSPWNKSVLELQHCERKADASDLASAAVEAQVGEAGEGPRIQRFRPRCLATPSPCKSNKGAHGSLLEIPTADPAAGSTTPPQRTRTRSMNLGLLTPQSCTANPYKLVLTPRTPDPLRQDLKLLRDAVSTIFFDFDGTLTATPGNLVVRQSHKCAELISRAALLAPRLAALRSAGLHLCIMSKSTEPTIRNALQAAGLYDYFDGPVVGKAVGLEGKVGFIEELAFAGRLPGLESGNLHRVLLVDDDVRELDRARAKGVQTWPAPSEGGLQDEDFEELFARLGLCSSRMSSYLAEYCSPKKCPAYRAWGYPVPMPAPANGSGNLGA